MITNEQSMTSPDSILYPIPSDSENHHELSRQHYEYSLFHKRSCIPDDNDFNDMNREKRLK